MKLSHPNPYGLIPANRALVMPSNGYMVLVGLNNAGKSTTLQYLFKSFIEMSEIGADKVAFLPAERSYVHPSAETSNRSLAQWNREYYDQLVSQPLTFESPRGPGGHELMRVILNHAGLLSQAAKLNDYLTLLGFDPYELRSSQFMTFPDGRIDIQGTGLRSLICILAALTDDSLEAILIDEPELYLEPSTQKSLRDLLIQHTNGRKIFVATHSHLFLDRANPTRNRVVDRDDGDGIRITKMTTAEDLYDLTFTLLGNDTQDLFFPGNYMIVEGGSETALCEKVASLLGIESGRIKFVAAGGVDRVKNRLVRFEDSLLPLVMRDSPYKGRVVVMIDKPDPDHPDVEKSIEGVLGKGSGRLFILEAESLEEYLPHDLYEAAGLNKENEIQLLESLNDANAKASEKQRISNAIASSLQAKHLDLPGLSTLVDAVKKAASY